MFMLPVASDITSNTLLKNSTVTELGKSQSKRTASTTKEDVFH